MRPTLLAAVVAGVLAAAPAVDVRVLDAVKNQDRAGVRSLLKLKAPINNADTDGTTALMYAAHVDDLDTVKLLLAAGADAKAANRYQVTALWEAANVGNGEMIELLLKAGADANAAVGQGETPLMTVSRTGSVRGVAALLAKGAAVNARETYRGETALMFAASENHPEAVKLLIAAGAEVDAKSKAWDFNFRKVASGGTQSIYYKGGFTALFFAARQGSVEAAQALLEGGANPNLAEPDYGFTPLLEAIYNDHYDLAAALVEKGANINGGALYVAVEMRNLDYFGNRPRKQVVGKLDELGFIKLLLEKGADANGVLKTKLPARQTQGPVNVPPGATPFYRAARSADVELMKLLLEHGADPSRAATDHTTPLMAAAAGQGTRFSGGEERPEPEFVVAIRLCIEKGADVNAVNDRGETAMHGAAVRGADQIVEFLASKGAKLDVRSKSGRTPYELAMGIGGIANTGGGIHASTGELIKKLMDSAR